ncbi:MFS multidrug transporter [Xylogone sp. PMI_703]|nr:MFS multidrug transporter [Xylogone sp. PMI_703]
MARGTESDVEVQELLETDPLEIPADSTIRRQLFILAIFPFAEAVAWTSIFPYVYFMVQSFSDSEDAAVYASLMVSVFTFGEFVMAPQWARISDRIGRKPTLLIGSMGAVFSAISFGLSSSLPMAMIARTLGGMLNPNLTIVPTFIGEMVSKEQQAMGFSVVPSLWAIGAIIGPVVGGYLAEPVKNYPSIFHEGTVWDQFPYLLPNIVVVVLLLSSCTLGLFYLKEVHPKFRHEMDIRQRLLNIIRNIRYGRGQNTNNGYTPIPDEENTQTSIIVSVGTDQVQELKSSAFTNQVILQIISNAILGFLTIAAGTMMPILLATPTRPTDPENPLMPFGNKGGFGLDTTGISNILLIQAITSIFSQFLIVPAIISWKGALRSHKIGLLTLLCIYCITPLSASLSPWARIASILVILAINALAVGLSLTCSVILITNTVPSPEQLAIVNGAAVSFGCLARTFGPAISGPLFRLGLEIGYIGLPFWLLGVVTCLGLTVSLCLRDHP